MNHIIRHDNTTFHFAYLKTNENTKIELGKFESRPEITLGETTREVKKGELNGVEYVIVKFETPLTSPVIIEDFGWHKFEAVTVVREFYLFRNDGRISDRTWHENCTNFLIKHESVEYYRQSLEALVHAHNTRQAIKDSERFTELASRIYVEVQSDELNALYDAKKALNEAIAKAQQVAHKRQIEVLREEIKSTDSFSDVEKKFYLAELDKREEKGYQPSFRGF